MDVDAAGDGPAVGAALAEWVSDLLGRLGLPARLSQVGVPEEGIAQLAEDAMGEGPTLANPREVSEEEFVELYGRSLSAGRRSRRLGRHVAEDGRPTSSLRPGRRPQPGGRPAALCPGGANRITGHLAGDSWGASCDAEARAGGFFEKAVLPAGVLMKAHVPDVAAVVPLFNVESIEATAGDAFDRVAAHGRRVEFESIAFNERFLATVAPGHDPIEVREMFSPSFLDWAARVDDEVDFGVSEQQLYFLWRLRELTPEEFEVALETAASSCAASPRGRGSGQQPYGRPLARGPRAVPADPGGGGLERPLSGKHNSRESAGFY